MNNEQLQSEFGDGPQSSFDIVSMLWRRKWLLLLGVVLGAMLGAVMGAMLGAVGARQ